MTFVLDEAIDQVIDRVIYNFHTSFEFRATQIWNKQTTELYGDGRQVGIIAKDTKTCLLSY